MRYVAVQLNSGDKPWCVMSVCEGEAMPVTEHRLTKRGARALAGAMNADLVVPVEGEPTP